MLARTRGGGTIAALAAALALVLAGVQGVTVSAFRATTSNGGNTFSAAASFGTGCPAPSKPYRITGFEPGVLSTTLFQSVTGAVSIDSAVRRTGAYSAKVTKASGSASSFAQNLGSTSTQVVTFGLRLETLPASDVARLLYFDNAVTDLELGYQALTQRLTLRFGSASPSLSSMNVGPATWYAVEIRLDTSANPHTAQWRVDGVNQPSLAWAETAATSANLYFGSDNTSDVFTAFYDDLVYTRDLADYPIGAIAVRALRPDGTGVHSGEANFQDDDGSPVDASSYTRVDESPMTSVADGIQQVTASATSYVELTFENTSETCVKGVQAVVAHHKSATGASQMKTSIFDGGTERVVFNGDPPGTAAAYATAVIAPAATTWSQSAVNGLVARIGYSTDTNPVPVWDALALEIAAPYTPPSTSCTAANPYRLTGFEHGLLNANLFNGVTGTPVIDGTMRRSGIYSVKIAKASGANGYVTEAQELSGVYTNVISVGLLLDSLPSADVSRFVWTSGAGSYLLLGYQASSQKLTLRWGTGSMVTSSTTVAAGVWYSVDLLIDTSRNPRMAEWALNGVSQTAVSSSEAAGNQYSVILGSNAGSDVFTAHYDDFFRSKVLADYPVGPVSVRPLHPNGMGTHSGAQNFQNNDSSAISANTYTRLDEVPMDSASDFIKQSSASATSYVELTMEDTAETCIKGVEAVVAQHKTINQANHMKTSVFDGTTERVVYSGDAGSTSVVQQRALVPPAASSWSQAALNGLVARMGYSTDANPDPRWDSLLLEYAVPYTGPLSYRDEVIADLPAAYWRLGEASGTTAADEHGIDNGTYSGGYALGQPGALPSDANRATAFNGTSGRVGVPHSWLLDLSSKVSIEAWVKPNTVAGTRYIVNKTGGSLYYLYVADGKIVFGIRSNGAYSFAQAVGVLTSGNWQHIVGTFNGSTFTIYHNGAKVAETTLASCPCPIDTATSELSIGSGDATTAFFDGALDEVAVYGLALTGTQVQTHYNRR